jgi:hypothetical protein
VTSGFFEVFVIVRKGTPGIADSKNMIVSEEKLTRADAEVALDRVQRADSLTEYWIETRWVSEWRRVQDE